jgi:glycosyltransferase involved in cell wall biosynthesis
MSNTMLESLCCGTPVVAVNNPENSANEFIVDNMNGFLVPDLSIQALARGLLRAMERCRSLDREWIRDNARDRFSYATFLLRYSELLKRVSKKKVA